MSTTLKMAALGQPFTLGMLYDARKDELIPGFTLWDKATLESQTSENAQKSSSFKITASDTIESRSSLMDIEASLSMSFCGGLIEVGGSAKYLSNQKKFKNQSRVTFQYKASTVFKQLSLPALGPLDSQQKQVIESSKATHLVTGILYGANAVFVFDSQKVDASSVQDIQGSMQAVVKKIPSFEISGSASVQLTEEEKKLTNKFSCTFYGDLILDSNPATFVQAVETYCEIPKLIADPQNSAPLTIWLYPLSQLYDNAAKLVQDLSTGLARKIHTAIEDENQIKMRCNDSLTSVTVRQIPVIYKNLSSFQKLCTFYKASLKQNLAKNLPSIRAGTADESALNTFLNDRENSPFAQQHLTKWLDTKERDINIVESCINVMLTDTTARVVRNQSELDRVVLTPGVTDVICYVFTDLDTKDLFLESMGKYLDTFQTGNVSDVSASFPLDVIVKMREKAQEFAKFAKLLKRSTSAKFLITALPNNKYTGATIYHYKDYKLISDNFSQPSMPPVRSITDRKDVIWYTTDLTLDQNTVSNNLSLTDGNKKATFGSAQYYAKNSSRFQDFDQVLCNEQLSGRHYWEVEWRGNVCLAVAYTSTPKTSDEVGYYKQDFTDFRSSWGISAGDSYLMELQKSYMLIDINWSLYGLSVNKLGVFLDYPGGTLSFYSIAGEKLKHLRTISHQFDQPLYAGFAIAEKQSYIHLTL
ncbi:stonustoxin subunit alpha-like [Syngnathus scovelli]|uniref:stonustoxin subunit alpha-like n=1 Tax=Syngnathus scovelli TaxID=161590 RepID=UPI0021103369|nr:stonustoxin subunit alpha-like [Syngnathus scovelli]